jgi:hypothetical protein
MFDINYEILLAGKVTPRLVSVLGETKLIIHFQSSQDRAKISSIVQLIEKKAI